MFNSKLYLQLDGVSMGGCLSPVLANAFMCIKEKQWLNDCPIDIKPQFYRRYVDDTFLLFRDKDHITKFKQYLNAKHPNIKFTSEIEENNQLPFIGVTVSHSNNSFQTDVYHKPTDTGLGNNYHSFTDSRSKTNSILTLLYRCYAICSSWFLFDEQIEYLHQYYCNNRYPSSLFVLTLRKFLNRILNPPPKSFDVPKDIKYIILPFFGHGSYMLRNKLSTLLKSYFPQCNIRFILCNRKSIGSIFPVKESLPARLCSNIIYQFTCENCSSSYVGSSTRTLHERVSEHLGKSFLTGSTLSSPKHSSIREHSSRNKHPMRADNFKIIGRSMPSDHIRLLESVYIRYLNPDLNDLESAMPLNII